MTDKYIIRTSDRGTFKRCRQLWDFSSKIRQNLEPLRVDSNLTFGTAIHRGLEVYYEPVTWDKVPAATLKQLAVKAFLDEWEKYRPDPTDADDEEISAFVHLQELGEKMLDGYVNWSQATDEFKPVHVEVEFEVPIKVPFEPEPKLPYPLTYNDRTYELHRMNIEGDKLPKPVVYQGRLDMIVEDEDGGYWIVDHKTTAAFNDSILDYLSLDPQCGSYAWAIQQQLGIKIEGVIYNQLLKTAPEKPKTLKSGEFSTDKRQNTTLALYKEACVERGRMPSNKEVEFMVWLEENKKPYFKRWVVRRSQPELELIGQEILLEALDMVGTPVIYRNPTQFNCVRCPFRVPCLSKWEGSDYDFILDSNYKVRESA